MERSNLFYRPEVQARESDMTPNDSVPDGDLPELQLIARGDRAAFERLFRAYEHRLYRYLLGLVRAPQTAEELQGDVMLEVWKSAARFRGQSKVSTWIFGIAHHKAMDSLRRHAPQVIDLAALAEVPDPQRGPEEVALAGSLMHGVREALDALSPEHRSVLELTFINGYSQAEIAGIVGCPLNTVKTRVFYAKQQLRRLLDSRGVRREM
jgi:RNA polymerase sigma-70 factor, ECF subfamily